jgi:hypothetical protein
MDGDEVQDVVISLEDDAEDDFVVIKHVVLETQNGAAAEELRNEKNKLDRIKAAAVIHY